MSDISAILEKWAEENYVSFVSRSSGQRTTDTVSRYALEDLIRTAIQHGANKEKETT